MLSYHRIFCCHVSVRPSVHPSQVGSSAKMAEPRIVRTTTYNSPGTPVCGCWRSQRYSNEVTPTGAQNRGGVGLELQIGGFRPISRYISETVQDRDIPWKSNRISYALHRMALFWVTERPLTNQNHSIIQILYPFSYSYLCSCLEVETSNLVGRLVVASPSPWMTNHPLKGCGQVSWTV